MENPTVLFQNFFEKRKIAALEDKVTIEYKSLFREAQFEYKYDELIESKVITGKTGEPAWTNLGYSLFLALMLLVIVTSIVFPSAFQNPFLKIFLVGIAVLMVVAFILRLVKNDCIWVESKEGHTFFIMILSRQNQDQGEKTINYILEKIDEAKSNARLGKDETTTER